MGNNLYKESLVTESIMHGLEEIGQGVQDMYLRDDSKLMVLIDRENISVFHWFGSRKDVFNKILDEINTHRLLGSIQPPSNEAPKGWEWTDYKEIVDDPL